VNGIGPVPRVGSPDRAASPTSADVQRPGAHDGPTIGPFLPLVPPGRPTAPPGVGAVRTDRLRTQTGQRRSWSCP